MHWFAHIDCDWNAVLVWWPERLQRLRTQEGSKAEYIISAVSKACIAKSGDFKENLLCLLKKP